MYKKLTDHFNTAVTLTPREIALSISACAFGAVACLMTGIVAGILISPRKTIAIGSHNSSVTGAHGNTPDDTTEKEEPVCEQS